MRPTTDVEGYASSLTIDQVDGCHDVQRCNLVVNDIVSSLCAHPLHGRPEASVAIS